MAVRTERRKKVGLLNGDGEIEETDPLEALSRAGKISIYIIIAQSSYKEKLLRLVIAYCIILLFCENIRGTFPSYIIKIRNNER